MTTAERIETKVQYVVSADLDPDTSYLEQDGFEDRLAEYRRDDFCYVGVRVRVVKHNWTTGVRVTVESAGLWGIESDSGETFFQETGADELAQITCELTERGIDIAGVEPELIEE